MFSLRDMGHNEDGSINREFCSNCYRNGHFTRETSIDSDQRGTMPPMLAAGAFTIGSGTFTGNGMGMGMGPGFMPFPAAIMDDEASERDRNP